MSTSRRELKKVRKFLNENRNWLCLEDCKKKKIHSATSVL